MILVGSFRKATREEILVITHFFVEPSDALRASNENQGGPDSEILGNNCVCTDGNRRIIACIQYMRHCCYRPVFGEDVFRDIV